MSFSAGLALRVGDGATTEVFTAVPLVFSLSGLGAANPTIDVTNWDSSAKEFISGLPEGQEVTIEMNRDISAAAQNGLITDVEGKVNRNFELDMDNGTAVETFSFTLAMTSWTVTPSFDDKHTLSIVGKISGSISRATV